MLSVNIDIQLMFVSVIIVCLSQPALVNLLILAHDMEMTSGDFVFITMNVMEPAQTPWEGHDRQADLRQAFRSVYHVSPSCLSKLMGQRT